MMTIMALMILIIVMMIIKLNIIINAWNYLTGTMSNVIADNILINNNVRRLRRENQVRTPNLRSRDNEQFDYNLCSTINTLEERYRSARNIIQIKTMFNKNTFIHYQDDIVCNSPVCKECNQIM